MKAFKERAKCIIDQFSAFEVEKGLNQKRRVGGRRVNRGPRRVNDRLRRFSKNRWKASRGRRTSTVSLRNNAFFLAYAHNWATNMRPEYARFLVNQDPHPLAKFRANGPLSNMPQFAQAFQCKAGDPMVRPEKDRCQIW